jgi:hypothetical protein
MTTILIILRHIQKDLHSHEMTNQISKFHYEKVLMLPVVYEKYNYLLLSMNFNAEFYKFYFTEKNFSKFALLLTLILRHIQKDLHSHEMTNQISKFH